MTDPNKIEIRPRVFVLEYPSQYELAATFLRFQECYESRRFRGKVFSLEQFMDWYAATYGNFTYFQDWSGFNLPSTALAPFYAGRFDPLSEKEQRLLRLFKQETGDFYMIGVCRQDGRVNQATLKHELAHSLFFMEPAYRREVMSHLKQYDTTSLEKKLYALGYCRQVLKDEVHAYVLADPREIPQEDRARLASLRKSLQKLYRRYVPGV